MYVHVCMSVNLHTRLRKHDISQSVSICIKHNFQINIQIAARWSSAGALALDNCRGVEFEINIVIFENNYS